MSHHMHLCMVLLLLCFYTAGAWGPDAYSKEDFPDPRKNFTRCGQEKASIICDPKQSLTKMEAQTLSNSLIESLQGSCLCDRFHFYCDVHSTQDQFMVAIVPNIKDNGEKSSETNKTRIQLIQEFAEYLRDKGWVMSHYKGCTLRFIIVIDLNTSIIWTATNLLVREVSTDDHANETALDAKAKYLRTGNVFGGLNEMLKKYKTLLHQGLPLLGRCIGWLFTGITIFILLVLHGISHFYSQRNSGRDLFTTSDGWSNGVWRVSGIEVVILVIGIAIMEVFGTVVGTAAVGAVVGATVADRFYVLVRTIMRLVLQTAIVMVMASEVGIMVAVPLGMTGTVGWIEVFGAALLMVAYKVIVIGVTAGVGVFGAAVLEVFQPFRAAAMVVVGGTAVVAGLCAAKTMQLVQMAEKNIIREEVCHAFLCLTFSALLSVVLLVIGGIMHVVGKNGIILTMGIFCCTYIVMPVLMGVVLSLEILGFMIVNTYGVVVAIVLVTVLMMVVAAIIVVPRKLSNVEVVEKVVESGMATEVGAVRAVVTGVLGGMSVAWFIVVFKLLFYLQLILTKHLPDGYLVRSGIELVLEFVLPWGFMLLSFAGFAPIVYVAATYVYI